MGIGRRGLLVGGGALLALGAARLAGGEAPLAFEPHGAVPGFRRIAAGGVSRGAAAGSGALIGLSEPLDPIAEAAREAVLADPCVALFGGAVPPGTVPVASFSDYNCPYCRVATEDLAAIEARSGGSVRVRWHELPLLGPGSEVAARAALAADRQGAYPAMHARLMRARLVPTPAYLEEVAIDLGLDASRLLTDMTSPEVEARLDRSAAAADAFGLPGTPAMVVGRTVVVGALGDRALERLIERERADGPIPGCST